MRTTSNVVDPNNGKWVDQTIPRREALAAIGLAFLASVGCTPAPEGPVSFASKDGSLSGTIEPGNRFHGLLTVEGIYALQSFHVAKYSLQLKAQREVVTRVGHGTTEYDLPNEKYVQVITVGGAKLRISDGFDTRLIDGQRAVSALLGVPGVHIIQAFHGAKYSIKKTHQEILEVDGSTLPRKVSFPTDKYTQIIRFSEKDGLTIERVR